MENSSNVSFIQGIWTLSKFTSTMKEAVRSKQNGSYFFSFWTLKKNYQIYTQNVFNFWRRPSHMFQRQNPGRIQWKLQEVYSKISVIFFGGLGCIVKIYETIAHVFISFVCRWLRFTFAMILHCFSSKYFATELLHWTQQHSILPM